MADQQAQERPGFLKRHSNTILAIAGLVITALTAYPSIADWLSDDRSLSYSTSYNKLFDSPTESFKLYYGNTSVSNVMSTNVLIYNTGEQSIKPEDVIEPIKIRLAPSCNVLSAAVTSSYPLSALDSFKSSISTLENVVNLRPKLINSGDSLVINVISSRCSEPSPLVEGRIDGVKEPKRISVENSDDPSLTTFDKILMLLYVTSAVLWSVMLAHSDRDIREAKIDRTYADGISDEERREILLASNSRSIKRAIKSRRLSMFMSIFSTVYLSYLIITN